MTTNASQQSSGAQTTKVGFLLGLGILFIPLIFSWFTLQKGYSTFARVVSFGWLILMIGIIGNPRGERGTGAETAAAIAPTTLAASEPAPGEAGAPPAAAVSNWAYNASTDQMRGTKSRFAAITSENELEFDFPYSGGSRGTLTLRDKAGDLNIMLKIEKGQFMCNSFSSDKIAAKFDDGPVQHFRCTDPSDGTSNVTFLLSEKKFLKALRASKKVIIEAEFFQEGPRQLTFHTAGLEW